MKRLLVLSLLVAVAVSSVASASARRAAAVAHRGPAKTVTVVHRGPAKAVAVVHGGHARTVVVVRRGFPISRSMPMVVVRPARTRVMVTPGVFLAPVLWMAAIASLPPHAPMVWEDSESLSRDDNWTDFTLNVNDRGRKLYLEIQGWAQLNFAEVVFANGETQVVDFRECDRGAGTYSVLDFKDGRKVSHVRMVARARADGTKLVLKMAK